MVLRLKHPGWGATLTLALPAEARMEWSLVWLSKNAKYISKDSNYISISSSTLLFFGRICLSSDKQTWIFILLIVCFILSSKS
jgi:hypothetical protein